jgi:hypothetical protein
MRIMTSCAFSLRNREVNMIGLQSHLFGIQMAGKTEVGPEEFEEVFVITAMGVVASNAVTLLKRFMRVFAIVKPGVARICYTCLFLDHIFILDYIVITLWMAVLARAGQIIFSVKIIRQIIIGIRGV